MNYKLLKLILSGINFRFLKFFRDFEFSATALNPGIISLYENKLGPGLEGLCKQKKSSNGLYFGQDHGWYK